MNVSHCVFASERAETYITASGGMPHGDIPHIVWDLMHMWAGLGQGRGSQVGVRWVFLKYLAGRGAGRIRRTLSKAERLRTHSGKETGVSDHGNPKRGVTKSNMINNQKQKEKQKLK